MFDPFSVHFNIDWNCFCIPFSVCYPHWSPIIFGFSSRKAPFGEKRSLPRIFFILRARTRDFCLREEQSHPLQHILWWWLKNSMINKMLRSKFKIKFFIYRNTGKKYINKKEITFFKLVVPDKYFQFICVCIYTVRYFHNNYPL